MANDWVKLSLPSGRHIGRFILWGSGRLLFSSTLFVIDGSTHILQVTTTLLKWTKTAIRNLIKVYDQLPYAGTYGQTIIDTTAVVVLEPGDIITDLTTVLDGKHCLIVGETGTGKSMIAQWLAYQIGGTVTVYDPDASPDEWQGLNVVGRCGDFNAIAAAMADDIEDLQARLETRGREGDVALAGKDTVTIAEEFPLLADEVDIATKWLLSHARRGRKPKRFIVALSQDDSVKALRIEGEGSVRKCFRMVRLGKIAVTHAKSLKDNALVEWLKAEKYRCTVDDYPCQLPDLSQFRAVTQQLRLSAVATPLVTVESTTEPTVEPIFNDENLVTESLSRAVKACMEAGLSDSKIIKEILGYQGSTYQQGKQLLASIRAEKT